MKRYIKQKTAVRGAAYPPIYPGFVAFARDVSVMTIAFDLDLALVSTYCWGLILKVDPFLEIRYQKKGTQHQGQKKGQPGGFRYAILICLVSSVRIFRPIARSPGAIPSTAATADQRPATCCT